MVEERKIAIRINLTGKLAKEFLYVKDRYGIKNNSEMVRQLISDAAFEIREKMVERAQKLDKLLLENPEIYDTVIEVLEDIKHHRPVRSKEKEKL